jgi:REP element-mobilizing transposase RayT
MPDHLHILTAPLDPEASVSAYSKWFKRWFSEAYCRPSVSDGSHYAQTWQWQEGCFDRLLRSDESLSEKWAYLSDNPVRAVLVVNSDDWPYQFACNADKL